MLTLRGKIYLAVMILWLILIIVNSILDILVLKVRNEQNRLIMEQNKRIAEHNKSLSTLIIRVCSKSVRDRRAKADEEAESGNAEETENTESRE